MARTFDVVVVDDAAEVRDVVRQQLELSGRFRVVGSAGTGSEAVALASTHQPALLLLDASMPELDGLAAVPAIRSAAPETKLVMLSGFDATSLRDTALRLGVHDYIEKSAPLRDLPARLLRLMGDPQAQVADGPPNGGITDGERLLASHHERFRTVFDEATIGMATLTLSGTIVRANRALAATLRRSQDELAGQPLEEVASEEDRAKLAGAIAHAAAGDRPSEVEYRLAGQGPTRWARSTVSAVRDSAGGSLYLFAQLEDITVRQAAMDELRASEERFRLMVESVQDYAIFMLDPGGHITTWNLGAQRLKGYTADQIIGRHFSTFYGEADRARKHPEHELALAVRDGRYEEEGWRFRRDGSQFWANVVITALFDGEGRHVGFAKVTRDMTERRAAEAARERAAANLAASNEQLQLAAKLTEEFVAVTAHELQSPVAAISGAADILLDYWDRLDVQERRETLGRISAGAGRIRRLLDDLLTASRIEAGTFGVSPERVSLVNVVSQAVNEVAGGLDVGLVGSADLHVQADPARLVQILTNLLSNAVKYGKPPYAVESSATDGRVEIRVRDAGAGPPKDLRPRLFQKFGTDRSSTMRGTGLGLYIVRELARLHGGDAWYEEDTTFAFSLPSAD